MGPINRPPKRWWVPVDYDDKAIWLGPSFLGCATTRSLHHAATGGPGMSITIQQILEVLRAAPEGLTAQEVSAKLGAASYAARGRLSKLAAYGESANLRPMVRLRR